MKRDIHWKIEISNPERLSPEHVALIYEWNAYVDALAARGSLPAPGDFDQMSARYAAGKKLGSA